jgi:hypothetical protein
MKKENIKKIISFSIAFGIFSLLFCALLTPINEVLAATKVTDSMQQSIEDFSLPGGDKDPEAKALSIVGLLINAFLSLFGIIFLILVIYGGYKWMMAAGREDEISSAKDIIRAAIIGLIIVLMSYGITFFIVSRLQAAAGQ